KPTDLQQNNDSENKAIDLTASVGLSLKEDGLVSDVVPGRAAHKAGVGPGMKLIAVNGRRWSSQVLRTALAGTKKNGRLELLLENGDYFQTVTLDYHDGERYPHLARDPDSADLLAAIVRPLVPVTTAGKSR